MVLPLPPQVACIFSRAQLITTSRAASCCSSWVMRVTASFKSLFLEHPPLHPPEQPPEQPLQPLNNTVYVCCGIAVITTNFISLVFNLPPARCLHTRYDRDIHIYGRHVYIHNVHRLLPMPSCCTRFVVPILGQACC